MTKRMLIDAAHAEETRVVVADGDRLEEFDYETSTKKQLKGNIYLAKVTRVEPSLQAAFVDYGGNRHGFLSFNEIHPDYYRIPVEDREALLAAETADNESDDRDDDNGSEDAEPVEDIGGDEVEDIERAGQAERQRLRSLTRRYRIQEVIKRRQILLVQVVKEERGNKGAALTTYLSLAGRYCVLMPNTARGGGISRKITNPAHRKRLRATLSDLDVPAGMAVIMRTAGVQRSKAEIRRDYEYLRRMWDDIRALTMKSTAPALIYEEANVIKRSLRDLYSRDIEEIIVDGDESYKTAKAFMKTMIPSHARRVRPYDEPQIPLFHRYKIEQQLDEIHDPVVHLRSGGYVVISPTEALVSIDVNSGRATRERNIEQTALKTNLEAAGEIARQLRLRDLAGLIVVDFIDMDESRNNNAVEKRLKEAMKNDRAHLQVGRISAFGLLELSRQRLRPSLLEASTDMCPSCAGSGVVRSTESTALRVLRGIEEEGIRRRSSLVNVTVPSKVALYILNQKREALSDIEGRYGFQVFIAADDNLVPPAYQLERVKAATAEEEEAVPEVVRAPEATDETPEQAATDEKPRRRRRRPRSRGADTSEADALIQAATDGSAGPDEPGAEDEDGRRRRRGRRGGRRRRREVETGVQPTVNGGLEELEVPMAAADETEEAFVVPDIDEAQPEVQVEVAASGTNDEVRPRTRGRPRRQSPTPRAPAAVDAVTDTSPSEADDKIAVSDRALRQEPHAPDRDDEVAVVPGPVKPDFAPADTPAMAQSFSDVAAEVTEPAGASGNGHSQAEPASEPAPASKSDKESPREPRRGWWQRLTS